MKRKALGKGLDALLPRQVGARQDLQQIELEEIRPNAFQPRVQFDPEKLAELAASIQENGVIQPIIVKQVGEGYELVAGERRWRAAQQAGLQRIPALIKELSEEKTLELALVENIQRDELSAIEEAHAYKLLIDQFSLSQEEVAQRVGKSRTAITNTLRLLRLPKRVQLMVTMGELSMGHARALLPLPVAQQLSLAAAIVKSGLSVRTVESRVKKLLAGPKKGQSKRMDPNTRAAIESLEQQWKTRVDIRRRGAAGQIILHFHSEEELQRLYEELLD